MVFTWYFYRRGTRQGVEPSCWLTSVDHFWLSFIFLSCVDCLSLSSFVLLCGYSIPQFFVLRWLSISLFFFCTQDFDLCGGWIECLEGSCTTAGSAVAGFNEEEAHRVLISAELVNKRLLSDAQILFAFYYYEKTWEIQRDMQTFHSELWDGHFAHVTFLHE